MVVYSFDCFFFSSRRRHTRCALVTGVQTCALPIFERENLRTPPMQADDVRRAFEPAQREKLVDGLLAQPVDIHRLAADDVLEPLGALRRADQPAGAANQTGSTSCRASVWQSV